MLFLPPSDNSPKGLNRFSPQGKRGSLGHWNLCIYDLFYSFLHKPDRVNKIVELYGWSENSKGFLVIFSKITWVYTFRKFMFLFIWMICLKKKQTTQLRFLGGLLPLEKKIFSQTLIDAFRWRRDRQESKPIVEAMFLKINKWAVASIPGKGGQTNLQ